MSRPEGTSGYERRDASRRLVVIVGIGLVVVTAVAMVLMRSLLGTLEKGEIRRQREPVSLAAGDADVEPPAPRLEAVPGENLAALQVREQEILTSYGWADQENGSVRIPLDRAMELIVERGLPVHVHEEAGR
jgi:HAMP domain-containing protein